MSEWAASRLGAVADVTVGHVGPMANEYRDEGIPFLRSLNVRPHVIDTTDLKFIGDDFHRKLRKSALSPGDVVTVRTGKPGQTAVIPATLPVANCSDLIITRPGPELNGRWLSYYLNWATATHIDAHLVGAVQQHFNIGSAQGLELPLPPLAEQRSIAEVLGALDDKIAANARLAALADEFALATFALFAAGVSGTKTLGEVATLVLGGTPSRAREEFWIGGDVSWLNSGKANEARVIAPSELITRAALAESATKMMPIGATLLAITGATLGQVARLEIEACGNQSLIGVWGSTLEESNWLHFAIRSSIPDLLRSATGAAQQHVNKRAVSELRVLFEVDAARAFGGRTQPLLQRAAQADRETNQLAMTRDALLPGLMSGKIRVKDAERVVEEVV